jgi:DNA-directed RNA polymerase subunit RPC12/RpoP
MIYEGWSKNSLATCIECGELFVIDFENPKFDNLNLIEIVGNTFCPKCNSKLKDTIKEYPKHIKLVNGEIGSFVSNQFIPNDNETIIAEFYEI